MRHVGSGSPQRSQSGGINGMTDDQQPEQTGPRVGASSGSAQQMQRGAKTTARSASRSARIDRHQIGEAPVHEALEEEQTSDARRSLENESAFLLMRKSRLAPRAASSCGAESEVSAPSCIRRARQTDRVPPAHRWPCQADALLPPTDWGMCEVDGV
jgi:hypothetical protein